MSESDVISQRREKVAAWRAEGVEPYAYAFARTHDTARVRAEHEGLAGEAVSEASVAVAGRLVTIRSHGKTVFAHLQDAEGRIQLYFRADGLPAGGFDRVKRLDAGDIVGVRGPVFRTRTGELTVRVESFALLTKALRPLPEKWHGLKDVELRYRRRYLDLIANERTRRIFRTRTRIVKEIRAFLDARGFIEVETPMMHPIPGGAAARPFVTHHNALGRDLYLRVAPELYLKRLLVGGFERVYEINRNFRNEGLSTMHNPEFTMLEVYSAYEDASAMMALTESLFVHVAQAIHGSTRITYQGQTLDLTPPWPRRSLTAMMREAFGEDVWAADADRLRALCREHGLDAPATARKAELFDALFSARVEPRLVQPVFVTDFPLPLSPLAKAKPGDPDAADRFEPYLAGHEFANGFSELSDPLDQLDRFEAQARQREGGGEEAHRIDRDYVRALEYGLPPAGGLGVGVDRLVMLMTDAPSIREVILFPQLRRPPNEDAVEEEETGAPEGARDGAA